MGSRVSDDQGGIHLSRGEEGRGRFRCREGEEWSPEGRLYRKDDPASAGYYGTFFKVFFFVFRTPFDKYRICGKKEIYSIGKRRSYCLPPILDLERLRLKTDHFSRPYSFSAPLRPRLTLVIAFDRFSAPSIAVGTVDCPHAEERIESGVTCVASIPSSLSLFLCPPRERGPRLSEYRKGRGIWGRMKMLL